jgi:DNA-binding response OmpR family regulator
MAVFWTLDPAVVLIAENDDLVADLLASVVELSGAVPLVAANGRQALELARTRRPALLITGSIMPELDGAGLIAALRAEIGAALPTILVTASPSYEAQAVGADAVLRKPFHIASLEAQLARFLPGSRLTGRADLTNCCFWA